MTSLETARSLANGPIVAGGWGGFPRELQRLLSLIGYGSTGGVCEWNLTEGKIVFTGRQTCSLYLVLWLCGQVAWRGRAVGGYICGSLRVPILVLNPNGEVVTKSNDRSDTAGVKQAFLCKFVVSYFCGMLCRGFSKRKNSSTSARLSQFPAFPCSYAVLYAS